MNRGLFCGMVDRQKYFKAYFRRRAEIRRASHAFVLDEENMAVLKQLC